MKTLMLTAFAVLTQTALAVNGDATWKKVDGAGTGGTNWTTWNDTANWTGGEAPNGTAARAYMNAGRGQYIELPETLTAKLITSDANTLLTLPVLRGDDVLKLYCDEIDKSSIQGVMLYSPYKILCQSWLTGLSLDETHICAPCVGLSKFDDVTVADRFPCFANRTYFHYDLFATELNDNGVRVVNDWPTNFNWDSRIKSASVGAAQMRILSPIGSDVDLTSKWVQTSGSRFLRPVAGGAVHTLSVGTRVAGEGIPADTYLKRVFPDDTIELSAAPTTSAEANTLTFAAIAYNTTLDYSNKEINLINQSGTRYLYIQKERAEDSLTVRFNAVSLDIANCEVAKVTLGSDDGYLPGLFSFDKIVYGKHYVTESAGKRMSFQLTLENSHLMPPKTAEREFNVLQSGETYSSLITVNDGEIRPLATSTYPMALQSLKGVIAKDGLGTWTLTTTNTTAGAYSGSLIVKEGSVLFLNDTTPIANIVLKAGAILKIQGELKITGTLTAEKGAIVSGGIIKGDFNDETLSNIIFEDGAFAIASTPIEGDIEIAAINGGVTRLSYQGDAIFVIDTNSTVKITKAGYFDMLVVGGGGGGGNMWGGGGGAGSVIYKQHVYLTNGVYSVKIGLGGLGSLGKDNAGNNHYSTSGDYSLFAGIKALGGGAGGTWSGNGSAFREGIHTYYGLTGASGGGAGMLYPTGTRITPGADGVDGYGNRGADGFCYAPGNIATEWRIAAGGGGGAGAAAVNAYTNANGQIVGSSGGEGIMVPIFGEKWYGGGGGGAARSSVVACAGGKGGGGDGAVSATTMNGADGVDGTGGGGGGASPAQRDGCTDDNAGVGGKGGNGIVILRCAQTPETKPMPSAPIATGGTIRRKGDYAIHHFTENGNFVIDSDSYVDLLIVGAGGGGGISAGGGGGGGAVIVYTNVWLKAGTYPVSIGKGGAGGISYNKTPHQYSYSGGVTTLQIGNAAYGKLNAIGGGGGGTRVGYGVDMNPKSGASGGGAGAPYFGSTSKYGTGAAGSDGYGFGGGASTNFGSATELTVNSWSGAGGGGGGAGGMGSNGWYEGSPSASNAARGGVGGMGIPCDFSGKVCYYGVGGSGGSRMIAMDSSGYQDNAQIGGARGGGSLNSEGMSGEDGVYGGGGGGSGACEDSHGCGGNGGDGLVIIRYRCKHLGFVLSWE